MPTLSWRCVNGPDLVEKAIDFISRGAVCHVEFLIDGQTIGARSDGGVQIRPLDSYPTDFRFTADCTFTQYNTAIAFLRAQIGKPYNFEGIVGVLTDTDLSNQAAWYCSQLWAATLQTGKIIRQLPKAVTNVTPEDALLISSAMFGTS